jgi:hypothetical protein
MFCHICGARLPDGASFCPGCGEPLQGQAQPRQARFETCEIAGRWKSGLVTDSYHFEAEAIGPRGPYIAARSREWKELAHTPRWKALDSANEEASEIVKELVSDLIKDGWEPVEERGTNWENFRFRRQIK